MNFCVYVIIIFNYEKIHFKPLYTYNYKYEHYLKKKKHFTSYAILIIIKSCKIPLSLSEFIE